MLKKIWKKESKLRKKKKETFEVNNFLKYLILNFNFFKIHY